MSRLHIKRIPGSLLEPANRLTKTRASCPFTKSTVLETLGEIACILAIGIVGWIALVIF